MAYPLVTERGMTNKLCKMHVFRGDGANGKGTFFKIMQKIYGEENCTYCHIEDLAKPEYVAKLVGKLVNLGDDVADRPIGTEEFVVIKNVTSGDPIMIRRLFQNPEETLLLTKLLFTSNHDLQTKDKGAALERRLRWMPMFNTVSKPDPFFVDKMTTPENLEAWVKLMVESYIRLFNNGWTESKICNDYNGSYVETNDIVRLFIKETPDEELLGLKMVDIKEKFEEWVQDYDGNRKFYAKNFKSAVWDLKGYGMGVKKINGKCVRVLMTQEETRSQDLSPRFK
jgi:putative DNA primase/helicase